MSASRQASEGRKRASNRGPIALNPRPVELDLLSVAVSGWSAYVLNSLVDQYGQGYLDCMSPAQRAEFQHTRRKLYTAAAVYHQRVTAVDGSRKAASAEIEAPSGREQLSVSDVAAVLDRSERRVRQLAERWQDAGLARKVGRTWLIDRAAVTLAAVPRSEDRPTRGAA